MKKCGCGEDAMSELYEHKEPHCLECLLDAIKCKVPILVREIDYFEEHKELCHVPSDKG